MRIDKPLETPQLLLRAYLKSDAAFCISLWCDPENGKFMSDPELGNADEKYLSYFDEMEDEPEGYFLIAELRETGAPVGTCCIFPEGDNYDIGYCIAKSHWQQGLGTEMLAAMIAWIKAHGGKSVTGEVADDNAASIALLRRFGFEEDRKTRYKKWGEEKYFDSHYHKLTI